MIWRLLEPHDAIAPSSIHHRRTWETRSPYRAAAATVIAEDTIHSADSGLRGPLGGPSCAARGEVTATLPGPVAGYNRPAAASRCSAYAPRVLTGVSGTITARWPRGRWTSFEPHLSAPHCPPTRRAPHPEPIDWIAEVAEPLAMRVMLAMMGLPESEHRRWQVWSRRRARLLEMIATRRERRAAHTTRLIGNGMLALVRNPKQMQRLRDEPERVRAAINEMLRFDSPVQTDFRIAKADIVVRGRTTKTGDGVILLTGSANRDGTAFENPDTFDITRTGPRHASFGHGVHQCIGAELARMEASAIFTEALRALGTIELAVSAPRYRTSTVIRGLAALPLRVAP